jgi:hypothetical protein
MAGIWKETCENREGSPVWRCCGRAAVVKCPAVSRHVYRAEQMQFQLTASRPLATRTPDSRTKVLTLREVRQLIRKAL